MFKRVNAWLAESYTCRSCGGTGYESNQRMLKNQIRSWSVVVLAIILVAARFWPTPTPARPQMVRPTAPVPR